MKSVANGCGHTIARNRIDSITTMTMGTIMGVNKNSNTDGVVCGGVGYRAPGSIGNCKRSASGFTLIEVLIVVAIIGILAAIAVPSYSIYITKANRTDAMNFLSEVAGEQQRYFSENNEYASSMKELGYGTEDTFPSPEGHYTISVTNSSSANLDYVISATPVVGGRQASDDECDIFTINYTGVKANTGGSNSNCW